MGGLELMGGTRGRPRVDGRHSKALMGGLELMGGTHGRPRVDGRHSEALMGGLELMGGTHRRPGTRACLLSIAVRWHRYWPQSPACKMASVCTGAAMGRCRVGPESQVLRQPKVDGNGEASEALDLSDDVCGRGQGDQYVSDCGWASVFRAVRVMGAASTDPYTSEISLIALVVASRF